MPLLAVSQPEAAAAARDAFAGKEAGRLRATLEGGKALTAHFTAETSVMRFLNRLVEARRKGQPRPVR